MFLWGIIWKNAVYKLTEGRRAFILAGKKQIAKSGQMCLNPLIHLPPSNDLNPGGTVQCTIMSNPY